MGGHGYNNFKLCRSDSIVVYSNFLRYLLSKDGDVMINLKYNGRSSNMRNMPTEAMVDVGVVIFLSSPVLMPILISYTNH